MEGALCTVAPCSCFCKSYVQYLLGLWFLSFILRISVLNCLGVGNDPWSAEYRKRKMCYVVGLASSGKVWHFFAFIHLSARLSSHFFCSVFRPFSKVGNSELHSTFFVHFSFYGSLSGGQNKVFAGRLMGRDSADRTLLKVKNKREIQGQNESCVKSSFAGFGSLCRKNLLSGEKMREAKGNKARRRRVGPITDGNQVNRMTKLRRTTQDIQH